MPSSAPPFNVIFIAMKMLRSRCLGTGAILRGDLMQTHEGLDSSVVDLTVDGWYLTVPHPKYAIEALQGRLYHEKGK